MGLIKKLRALGTLGLIPILLIISIVVLLIFMRSKQGINRKQVLRYALLTIFMFLLCSCIIFTEQKSAMVTFVILQSFALVLGTLHCWLMYLWFKWASRETFWAEFLFTLFVTCAGVTIFLLVTSMVAATDWGEVNIPDFVKWYSLAFITFLIPYLVLKLFDYAWAVPPTMYKLWYYPVGADIPDPSEFELEDHMKIVEFELDHLPGEDPQRSEVKIPERMEIGQLFMAFIHLNSRKQPDKPIEYMDENQNAYGWIFSRKKKVFFNRSKIYNPEATFNDNKIKERDIIIAERVEYE